MQTALNLSSSTYQWLLTIFYISYIVFQPLGLMYQVVPPHIWGAFCVLGWGITGTLQAATYSWAAMMVARFFLVSRALFWLHSQTDGFSGGFRSCFCDWYHLLSVLLLQTKRGRVSCRLVHKCCGSGNLFRWRVGIWNYVWESTWHSILEIVIPSGRSARYCGRCGCLLLLAGLTEGCQVSDSRRESHCKLSISKAGRQGRKQAEHRYQVG